MAGSNKRDAKAVHSPDPTEIDNSAPPVRLGLPGALAARGGDVTLCTLEAQYDEEVGTIFVVCTDDDGDGGPARASDVERIGLAFVREYGECPYPGTWLVPEAQGESYGIEVGSLLVGSVFSAFDTPTVKANACDFNDASRGLPERLGFQQECRHRNVAFLDGAYRDRTSYRMLREEWENPLDADR